MFNIFLVILQAFVKTAAKILKNIQEGVFDVSNEVCNWAIIRRYRNENLVELVSVMQFN